jgi:hypothetical protein
MGQISMQFIVQMSQFWTIVNSIGQGSAQMWLRQNRFAAIW